LVVSNLQKVTHILFSSQNEVNVRKINVRIV